MDEEMFKAFQEFEKSFKDNFLLGIQSIKIDTSKIQALGVTDELTEKAEDYLKTITMTDAFDDAPKKTQKALEKMAQEVVDSITEADFASVEGDEEELLQILLSRMDQKVGGYMDLIEAAQELSAETGITDFNKIGMLAATKYAEEIQAVQRKITEYNKENGTKYTLADIITAAINPEGLDDAEKDIVDLQTKIDNLYKSVRASIDEANFEDMREGGWLGRVSQLEWVLNLDDFEKQAKYIQIMIEDFAKMKFDNPEYFDAMAEDLDGLEEIIALFADGDITEADINKALEIFNNRVKFASENGESAADAIKSVRDALTDSFDERKIEEATEANFSNQRAELQKFLPDLETDKAFDEDGLFAYLASLDDGMLDALYEFYPPLEEALELINSTDLTEKQEGIQLFTQAILAMGDAWTVYAEKYREAQESEIDDDEGLEIMQNLGKELNTKGIEGYQEAFVKLTKEEQEWVEANSKAHKKIAKSWDKGEDGIKDNTKEIKKFNRELKKLELDKLAEAGDIWEEVADIADEGVDTEEELIQAYGAFQEKLDEIVEAQGDLNFVMSATDKTTDDYTDAISNLESVCGFAIDSEQDLALAQMFLASQMDTATMSSATLLNYLMGISGSTFNAATWETELAALAASGNSAAICMQNLIANIKAVDGARINYANGVFSVSGLGSAAIRRSGSSGGGRSSGGGGGGSSGSGNEMSEIEKMLDLMEQVQKLQKHHTSLIGAHRDYYEEAGYLTSIIRTYEEERAAI